MAPVDRLNAIRQLLLSDKQVFVSELSKSFRLTEETIRRDLDKLEADNFLKRTYGGAILNPLRQDTGVNYYKRSVKYHAEKRAIAVKALPLLADKATAAIDSSSTVMEVVKLLGNREGLTLLTNSTYVFQVLESSKILVVSSGGVFDRSALSLVNKTAENTLRRFNIDIALVGCKGLDLRDGVLDSRESGASVKRVMIEQASEVALLVDHTKFDKKAFVFLTELERLDYIVTDQEPSDDWKQLCEQRDIKLIF